MRSTARATFRMAWAAVVLAALRPRTRRGPGSRGRRRPRRRPAASPCGSSPAACPCRRRSPSRTAASSSRRRRRGDREGRRRVRGLARSRDAHRAQPRHRPRVSRRHALRVEPQQDHRVRRLRARPLHDPPRRVQPTRGQLPFLETMALGPTAASTSAPATQATTARSARRYGSRPRDLGRRLPGRGARQGPAPAVRHRLRRRRSGAVRRQRERRDDADAGRLHRPRRDGQRLRLPRRLPVARPGRCGLRRQDAARRCCCRRTRRRPAWSAAAPRSTSPSSAAPPRPARRSARSVPAARLGAWSRARCPSSASAGAAATCTSATSAARSTGCACPERPGSERRVAGAEAPVREHRPVPARLPLLTWGLAAVAIAASVVELAIDAGLQHERSGWAGELVGLGIVVVVLAMGLLVVHRSPVPSIGLLLIALATMVALSSLGEHVAAHVILDGGEEPWWAQLVLAPDVRPRGCRSSRCVVALALLFPTGRPLTRRWRRVLLLAWRAGRSPSSASSSRRTPTSSRTTASPRRSASPSGSSAPSSSSAGRSRSRPCPPPWSGSSCASAAPAGWSACS